MIDQRTLNKIQKWENFKELDPVLKQELEEIKNNEDALLDAFYTDIAFGTLTNSKIKDMNTSKISRN